MQSSTDAAQSENTGNSGKWVRRHTRHVSEIERRNQGKLLDWVTSTDISAFVTVRWGNLQIDPNQVKVGDKLLIALKEEVIVGSHKNRLIARYNTIEVRTPEMCIEDELEHAMSVCTQCIHESWLYDYFFRNIRTLRNFAHGSARAYDYFGCRCDQCTVAHSAYLVGTLTRDGAPAYHG